MTLASFVSGQALTASALNQLVLTRAFKGADTSRASNTTQTNDPDLAVPVLANAEYFIDMMLTYTQGPTGQLVIAWTAPTAATFDWMCTALDNGTTASNSGSIRLLARQIGDTQTIGGNTSAAAVRVSGRLVTSATPGTLQLTWAQSVSNATAVVVQKGSFLIATPMG